MPLYLVSSIGYFIFVGFVVTVMIWINFTTAIYENKKARWQILNFLPILVILKII